MIGSEAGVNKVCVILGAGASFDVRNEGSPTIRGEWRPPLARDLFDIEAHPSYTEILQRYPGANFLANLLAPNISAGPVALERELRHYAEHNDLQLRQHFKHVPPYLRDLIDFSCRTYTHTPSCHVQLVTELLAENPHEILFLILNYDNLLEQALTSYDPNWAFDTIDSYAGKDRIKVVKLHGSVNWFVKIRYAGPSWWDSVAEFDIFARTRESDLIVQDNADLVNRWKVGRKWAYPLLTAPLAGKDPSDSVCPRSHLNVAEEFIRDCKKFLIIGTSGMDQDLLALLDSTMVQGQQRRVDIVDHGDSIKPTTKKFTDGVSAFREGEKTRVELRGGGYREYVSSDHFHEFAQYDPSSND